MILFKKPPDLSVPRPTRSHAEAIRFFKDSPCQVYRSERPASIDLSLPRPTPSHTESIRFFKDSLYKVYRSERPESTDFLKDSF